MYTYYYYITIYLYELRIVLVYQIHSFSCPFVFIKDLNIFKYISIYLKYCIVSTVNLNLLENNTL